jgi:hypothetical protein
MKKESYYTVFQILLLWILGAQLPTLCQSQDHAQLYVSPSGNDADPGTFEQPMATLQGAKDKIRSLKASGNLPQGGITVYLREGTYVMQETVVFGPEDGGTQQAPIIYRNYEDEEVRLSGGVEIPQKVIQEVSDPKIIQRLPQTARNKVWMADLKALGITDYGQLYQHGFSLPIRPAPMELFMQGKPQTLARWLMRDPIPAKMIFPTKAVFLNTITIEQAGGKRLMISGYMVFFRMGMQMIT